MAKLYELADDFRLLFDSLDTITDDEDRTEEERAEAEQEWFDMLCCFEAEFEEKAENVAAYIKKLNAEADMLYTEEKALRARRKQKESAAKKLTGYLLKSMDKASLKRIDRPKAVISIRNNAEAPVFDDEKAFISWAEVHCDDLLRYREPEISRTAVKEYLQAGNTINGVHLERSRSVIIK